MSRSLIFIIIFALITIVLGSPAPGNTSPDWSCGGKKGYVCPGSNCCSSYGWCGTGNDFCDSGCQPQFGSCSSSQSPSTQGGRNKVSPDGTCGGRKGYTCLGSESGDCCSQYGYCGNSNAYCGTACQPGFGNCNGAVKSSTKPSTKSSTQKTSSKSSTKPATKSSTLSSTKSNTKSSTKSSTKSITRSATRSSTKSYTLSGTSSSVVPSTYSPPPTSVTSSEPPATSSVYSTASSSTSSSYPTVSASATSSTSVSEPSSSSGSSSSSTASSSLASETSSVTSSSEASSTSSSTSSSSSLASSSSSVVSSTSSLASSSSLDVSSSSTTFATSITASSTSSSAAASSSAPTCKPNLLQNGDFNTGTEDPFSISIGNGGGNTQVSVVTVGDIPSDDGTPFLQTTTASSPTIFISQQITGILSGTALRCSMDVLVPTQTTFDQIFSVNFEINGQSCASIGGVYTSDWLAISNFAVYTSSNDPVSIEITVTWTNANDYTLDLGLDNLFVWVDTPDNANLGLCPPGPTTSP